MDTSKEYIITTIERSGRQSDNEWEKYQRLKIKEHLRRACFNKIAPIEGDRISLMCAFMKMDGRLKDPAGYRIIGYK